MSPRRAFMAGSATLIVLLAAVPAAHAGPEVELSSTFGDRILMVEEEGVSSSTITVNRTGATVTVTDSTTPDAEFTTDDSECTKDDAEDKITCTPSGGILNTLTMFMSLEGGNDTVTIDPGMSYGAASVYGGSGTDTFNGGAGTDIFGPDPTEESGAVVNGDGAQDTFHGNGGTFDRVDYGAIEVPVTVTLDTTRNDGPEGLDLIHGDTVENILGTRSQNDTLTGNGADNRINGGCCDDTAAPRTGTETLTGSGGNDTFEAAAQDQTMIGGEGDDTFILSGSYQLNDGGETDDDTVTGGPGTDTASYATSARDVPVTVNLAAGSNNGITQGTPNRPDENDTFVDDIENFRGAVMGDTVIGNDLPNEIFVDNDLPERQDNVVSCGGAADIVHRNGNDLVDSATCETIMDGGGGGTSIAISNASLTEGNAGQTLMTFTVTRTGGSGTTNFAYATGGGTATAGADYLAASGTGTITGTSTAITVPVLGDTADEPNETFNVSLSAPSQGTISDPTGVGTITDDDAAPGGPGGDGGGGGGVGDAIDSTPPDEKLSGSKAQKVAGTLSVTVACDEDCTATATGSVNVPNAAKVYRLKKARRSIKAGGKARLKLKLSKKARKAAKRALIRRKKVRAKITVTVVDAAGNKSSTPRTIKLKR